MNAELYDYIKNLRIRHHSESNDKQRSKLNSHSERNSFLIQNNITNNNQMTKRQTSE
jgi:hypothetical protein